ncbi:MAG: SAM-dependent methyltransferase, partial [Gemmatimonadaceae bacterium]|nr:SAM-dependent methyltransferase [Acetobacteraceae bacterium]
MEHTFAAADGALLQLARAIHATGYEFVTPTPATIVRVRARPGTAWAHDLRDVFGWSRPFRTGAVLPAIVAAMEEAGVLLPHEDGHRSAVRLSSLDGLLFMHSAFPTDAADAVFFGPDTYRFARAIAAHAPVRPVHRAVDVGCGA